ncbi:MAG: hypothetical protein RIC14_03380 [Filomicrobium sp.]
MIRVLMLLAGGFTFVTGALLLPLPLPLGLPLLLVGGAILLSFSPAIRRWFKHWRTEHRQLSDRLENIEPIVPSPLRETLNETHPDQQDANSKKQ